MCFHMERQQNTVTSQGRDILCMLRSIYSILTVGHIQLCSQTPMEQSQVVQYEHNLATCYEAEYLLSIKIQEDMCSVNGLCRSPEYSYDDSSEVISGCNQPPLNSKVNQPSLFKPGDCLSFLRGANGYHRNGMVNSSMTVSSTPQSIGSPMSQPSPCTDMDCTTSYEQTHTTVNMPLFQAQDTQHYPVSIPSGVTAGHYRNDVTAGYTFPFSQRYMDSNHCKQEEEGVHSEGPVRKKHRPEY